MLMKILSYRGKNLNSEGKLSKGHVNLLESYFTAVTSLPRWGEKEKKKDYVLKSQKKPRETEISVIIYTYQVFVPLLADSSPEAVEFFQSWLCSLFPVFLFYVCIGYSEISSQRFHVQPSLRRLSNLQEREKALLFFLFIIMPTLGLLGKIKRILYSFSIT